MRVLKFNGGEVPAEWVDYNGHMNVAYFALAFDRACDVLFDELDLGKAYTERSGQSAFAVQSRYHYISEIRLAQLFSFEATILDYDTKRLHTALVMHRADTLELVAACEQLFLSVDLRQRQSSPWMSDALERLKCFVETPDVFELPKQMLRPLRIRQSIEEFARAQGP